MDKEVQENIKKTINEKGEKWIKYSIVAMDPQGFLWLCHLLEGAQKSHDNAFKDIPKSANPGFSISDFLEIMQNTILKLDEDELPINPDGLIAFIEYYRDKYGPHEGWNKFTRVVSASHESMKLHGKISAKEDTPMIGKGCFGVILLCVSISIVFGYFGFSLITYLG